jgi:uncharacterized protein YjgD (DUF1641 family)
MTTLAQPTVDERLAAIAAQLDELTRRLDDAEARRRPLDELAGELAPVTAEAFLIAANKLDDHDIDLGELGKLALQMAEMAPLLQRYLGMAKMLAELGSDASPLTEEAVAILIDRLGEADRKGYFTFAKGVAGVVDRVVTAYDEDDVAALGDNIVLILDTVKEMTQPEVMTMLRRTVGTVGDAGPEEIGLLGLVRATRDPDVKRGLGRLVALLRSLGGPAEGGK